MLFFIFLKMMSQKTIPDEDAETDPAETMVIQTQIKAKTAAETMSKIMTETKAGQKRKNQTKFLLMR